MKALCAGSLRAAIIQGCSKAVETRLMMLLQITPSRKRLRTQNAPKSYEACPHCGSRLMAVLSPSARTYPLPVERCPICGYRRDDEGVTPGRALSHEEKMLAARQWLALHDLDEALLQRHYHLSLEHFFVGVGEVTGDLG